MSSSSSSSSKIPKFVNIDSTTIEKIGKYKIYGQIGRGSFGLVLLGKKSSSKNFVVIKVPLKNSSKQIKETEDEIRFLYHPKYKKNCKKFYCLKETFSTNDRKIIVLDLLDGVHLEKIIRPKISKNYEITARLSRKEKIDFINNLIKTLIKNLQFFHRLGLSHGDIHTGNIMYLPAEKKAMVVYFGMSCQNKYYNYFAVCNAGFVTGNPYYQTERKRNADSEIYRNFNTLKTHQSDDVFALNNIITIDISMQSFIFKDVVSSVPILRKWKKAFPIEVIVDDKKRLKAFQNFK